MKLLAHASKRNIRSEFRRSRTRGFLNYTGTTFCYNCPMKKKILLGFVISFLLSLIIIGPNVVNASDDSDSSVNNFIISDFQADYYLDKDIDGRSTLKTVEQITAEFPAYDQNHGIERAIPIAYDGHKTNVEIESVQDQSGNRLEYSIRRSGLFNVIRIGNADVYVHGVKTYVISYTQRDVTKYFSDTNDDEFYWDTNGTGWSQTFSNVTARLHINPSIADSLNGKMACYYGAEGSTNRCDIDKSGDGVISASVSSLLAGENMTISVGFKANTFSPYQETYVEINAKYLAIFMVIVSVGILGYILYLRFVKGRAAPSTHAIVPEYLPPKGADVPLSSIIAGKSANWMSAAIIDLAVRHKIKIIEHEKKWWQKPKYTLQLVSDKDVTDNEKYVINALFAKDGELSSALGLEPNSYEKSIIDGILVKDGKSGSTCELDPNKYDAELMNSVRESYEVIKHTTDDAGYYIDVKKMKLNMAGLTFLLSAMLFGANYLLSENMIIYSNYSAATIVLIFIIIFAVVALVFSLKPLSAKGRELSDYLKGLKLYIKIGEEDRLKVLQSPQGAEKTPINTNDTAKLVRLYERVLPYAVLFDQEKEWTKVLGKYYEQQNVQPTWFVGTSVFNAAAFSSSLSSFASSSSASSGTGGSGGGGSSGGGGGGGGGSGW